MMSKISNSYNWRGGEWFSGVREEEWEGANEWT
jgi:hypothetical protein